MKTVYAVRNGRYSKGIFTSWEDCKIHVEDYDDAEYAVFDNGNFDEAASYIASNTTINTIAQQGSDHSSSASPPASTKKRIGRPLGSTTKKNKQTTTACAAAVHNGNAISTSLPSSSSLLLSLSLPLMPSAKKKPKNKQQIANDIVYESYVERLRQFKADHGHCNVPQNNKHGKLGTWVNTQRKNFKLLRDGGTVHKDGRKTIRKSPLTAERMQQLVDIGFVFRTRQLLPWEERAEELREFKEKHGNFDVPNTGEYKTLHAWFETQLRLLKRHQGVTPESATDEAHSLTDERIQIFNDLGVDFQRKHRWENQWEKKFDLLCLYKEQYGNCLVPKKYVDGGLGEWVVNQRKYYKKISKSMSDNPEVLQADERIQKLTLLGFDFSLRNRSVYKR